MKTGFRLLALAAAATVATQLHAETLNMRSFYPANAEGVAEIRSISIENFDGYDGPALALAAESSLGSVSFDGNPYFTIMASRAAVDPDAILSGSASYRVADYDVEETRNRCVERNDKGKCVQHKNILVPCLKRVVDFEAMFRLSRYSDGETMLLRRMPDQHEQTVCEDEYLKPLDNIVDGMISASANSIRRDLAPADITENIRVLESRKGMKKAEANSFKAAIAMTKTNQAEACRMWSELESGGVVQGSLAHNIALCSEQAGNLDEALALYLAVEERFGSKSEVAAAIRRVNSKLRAQDEWALRYPKPQNAE